MKLCVLANLYAKKPLEEVLGIMRDLGVDAVEIGCGGYPGKDHCDPEVLLNDDAKLKEWLGLFDKYGIELAALACHGNPVHPDKKIAEAYDRDFRNACLLAEKVGVDTIITFSGCPGDHPGAKYPNWVTCPWPDDFLSILDYQWNEVLIPYWKEAAAFAKSHGVTHVALELHPGFCCYNTETLLKLRAAVGDVIGANFDPSHLVWQGMEPAAAIRMLGDAIYHVHAKDTKIDEINTARIGVLDTKHYGDEINRAWVFRTVGYGHDAAWWRDLVDNLRLVGYDRVLSIEHEDSLMSIDEGLKKAVGTLKEVIMKDPKPSTMAWA
ncbi:MAG: sugar phosphate isomerase/epimerase [Clostridia bacterium]|nr:sugar phosphate isomerase/epimerase [Clostridia bacterium]